jgi:hypothetical protein
MTSFAKVIWVQTCPGHSVWTQTGGYECYVFERAVLLIQNAENSVDSLDTLDTLDTLNSVESVKIKN